MPFAGASARSSAWTEARRWLPRSRPASCELRRFDAGSVDAQVRRAQRKLCRAQRGSRRRGRVKARLARLHARRAFTRTDWVEKLSTQLARRFDLIRVEGVRVTGLTRADLPNQAVAPFLLQSRTRRDGSRLGG